MAPIASAQESDAARVVLDRVVAFGFDRAQVRARWSLRRSSGVLSTRTDRRSDAHRTGFR
jgi:hypothetical protein